MELASSGDIQAQAYTIVTIDEDIGHWVGTENLMLEFP